MREGWQCPLCGGAHSPDTATCPDRTQPRLPPGPTFPPGHFGHQFVCEACRRGGVCGCVRPERSVTC